MPSDDVLGRRRPSGTGRTGTGRPVKESVYGLVQQYVAEIVRRPVRRPVGGPVRRRATADQGAAADGRGGPQPVAEGGFPGTLPPDRGARLAPAAGLQDARQER